MKIQRKAVVIGAAVLATGALAAGAAWAFKGGFFGRIYGKVKSELALTADQEQKVDALKERAIARFKAKKADHHALINEAKAIWLEDSLDASKIDALVAKVNAQRAEQQKFFVSTIKELHGILTKDQRAKLVQVLEKMRGKFMKRHMEHGKRG
jgi:Spy/CpxP family protein refolding chaperone